MSVRPWSETIPEAKSVLATAGYALVIDHIEAERDRYRELLEFIAWDEWTEDDPLKVRDRARQVLDER